MDILFVEKLQELLRRTMRLRSLVSAKACSSDPTTDCAHGATCKGLRASLSNEHAKTCNSTSCKDFILHAEDKGMIEEWEAHANNVLRKHCLRCRYALDGDEAMSSLQSTLEAFETKSAVNANVLQRHVAAVSQPPYRVPSAPSQAVTAALAVLRTAPADRTRSVQHKPTHTHLNLLLSSVSNPDVVPVSSSIGLSVDSSAAIQRVLVELQEGDKAAVSRQQATEARPDGRDGARLADLAKLEPAILANVLVLAEKKNNLAERLRLLREVAKSGRQNLLHLPVASLEGLATSDTAAHKRLHEAWVDLNKAAGESVAFIPTAQKVGKAFVDYQMLAGLLSLDHRPLYSTLPGGAQGPPGSAQASGQLVYVGYQDAPATDGGKIADESRHTRYLVEAGVCSPGGAGLALRMADRVRATGTGVELVLHKAAPEAPGSTWPRPSEQAAILAELGASNPTVAEAAPAASLAQAELQSSSDSTTIPGAQLRKAIAAVVQKRALQSIMPAFTGEKDKAGGSAYAYMRDLVSTQALDLLSGVIATARARQIREIEALRLSTASSGASASASSSAAAPLAPVRAGEPPRPLELLHSGLSDADTLWHGISNAWAAWYRETHQYVLTQAKMGYYNKKALEPSMKELLTQIPQPPVDKAAVPGGAGAGSGSFSFKAMHDTTVKAACQGTCKAWYERAIREQIHRAAASGAAVDVEMLRRASPEEVDRLSRQVGRGLDTAQGKPSELLQHALQQTAAVDGEGKLVLPGASAPSSDAQALAAGVNTRVTLADVVAYLHAQLTGAAVGALPAHMTGQGSSEGQEGDPALSEGERQAPLYVHVLEYARADREEASASTAAAGYGQVSAAGASGAQEAAEQREGEHDDGADATDAEGDMASVMTGRHSEVGQAAQEKASASAAAGAGAGAGAGGAGGRAKRQTAGKNSKFLEESETAGRKRGRAAETAEDEEAARGAPAKRSNARHSGGGAGQGLHKAGAEGAGEGATAGVRTLGEEVRGSFLNFEDVRHPLHRARAFPFLPGRTGGDQPGEFAVGDLHTRLARLREVAPPISRHPRAVSFMRLALARARERVALSQEGSDLRLDETKAVATFQHWQVAAKAAATGAGAGQGR